MSATEPKVDRYGQVIIPARTKDPLLPLAEALAIIDADLRDAFRMIDDAQLLQTFHDLNLYGTTNCWWAEYRMVRDHALPAVEREMYRRGISP